LLEATRLVGGHQACWSKHLCKISFTEVSHWSVLFAIISNEVLYVHVLP
jgi:hypothetical protein